MYQYAMRVPGEKTPAGKRTQPSPQALKIAHDEIANYIKSNRPQWTLEMRNAVAWDILRRIDWNNESLMHKSLKWITEYALNTMCPKE